jgi:iron complex transport system ATP-binding protein
LFRKLDLTVNPGSLTVVVGPNGSGKTTLLRTLVGLRAPDEGDVQLQGCSIQSMPRLDRARAIAYLPQTTTLYHELTVREVVMLGRLPHLGRLRPPAAQDHAAVTEALAQVGLRALAERGTATLSGGERQRVMLARMLATGAPVLVLDEPTAALDIGHALALLELCRRLSADGRTIVLALHDLELARRYGHDAVCLTGNTEGTSHRGLASDVLIPAVLSEVFEVAVHLGADGLVIVPR